MKRDETDHVNRVVKGQPESIFVGVQNLWSLVFLRKPCDWHVYPSLRLESEKGRQIRLLCFLPYEHGELGNEQVMKTIRIFLGDGRTENKKEGELNNYFSWLHSTSFCASSSLEGR